MKVQIRIISQNELANPNTLPLQNARLKVHGSYDVNLPEPLQGNDTNNMLMRWMYAYQRVLVKDPSAQLKITPYLDEKYIPF